MARAQYTVVLHEASWKISFNGQHHGPYPTQREAIRVAIETAYKAGLVGHDAEVLVQESDNKIRTEWTYGHDPYPEPGLAGKAHSAATQAAKRR